MLEPLGDSLVTAVQRYIGGLGIGLPVPVVQRITKRMVKALDYLHKSVWCGRVLEGVGYQQLLL